MHALETEPLELNPPEAAWLATDLSKSTTWAITIPEEVIAEIGTVEAEIASPEHGSKPRGEVRWALPATRSFAARLEREILFGRGFALLQGLDPSRSDAWLRSVYWLIGCLIGTPLSQDSHGSLLTDVTDRGLPKNAPKGNGFVRGYETNEHLGFHTDRADIVGLLCIRPAKSGGTSSIASALSVHDKMAAEAPHLLDALYNGLLYPNVEEGGDRSVRRIPVFSSKDGIVSCRYSRGHYGTAIKNGLPYTDDEIAALDFVDRLAADQSCRLDMELQRGDIQFINNFTTLHSRTEYVDDEDPRLHRCLARLWLKGRHARPLHERFEPYVGIPATIA